MEHTVTICLSAYLQVLFSLNYVLKPALLYLLPIGNNVSRTRTRARTTTTTTTTTKTTTSYKTYKLLDHDVCGENDESNVAMSNLPTANNNVNSLLL